MDKFERAHRVAHILLWLAEVRGPRMIHKGREPRFTVQLFIHRIEHSLGRVPHGEQSCGDSASRSPDQPARGVSCRLERCERSHKRRPLGAAAFANHVKLSHETLLKRDQDCSTVPTLWT